MFIDAPDTIYTVFARNGVICLSIAALVSLLAILFLLIFKRPTQKEFQNGHMFGYFISLLVANGIQAVGTLLNFVWVGYNAVMEGTLCNLQGGVTNFGNIAAAYWSLMITIQLFNLLFLRWASTKWGFWLSLVLGWGGCFFIVIIGPAAIQKPDWPSYFGPDGSWCWITSTYRLQQIFLEYFLEYLSVGISFVLYIFILLRVRGNLILTEGKWRLRKVPVTESWKPCFTRDPTETKMLRMARMTVWFPIAYMALLIPVSVARFCDWSGSSVPFEVTILTNIVFALNGFVDVLLLLYIEHLFPDLEELAKDPHMTMKSGLVEPLGRSFSQKYRRERGIYIPYPERAHFPAFTRKMSAESAASDESWGNDVKDYV